MVPKRPRPLKRDGSNVKHFIRRIPEDVKEFLVGRVVPIPLGGGEVRVRITQSTQSFRFSLRTKDTREAELRNLEALAYIERLIQDIRAMQPIHLDRQNVDALAGELYQSWSKPPRPALHHDPRKPDVKPWLDDERDDLQMAEAVSGIVGGDIDRADLGRLPVDFKPIGEVLLASKGISRVTPLTEERLSDTLGQYFKDALKRQVRYFQRDYGPDGVMLPTWGPVESVERTPGVTLTAILQGWTKEAEIAGRTTATVLKRGSVVQALISFLGHEDATKITPADLVAYKEHRLSTAIGGNKVLKPQSFKVRDLGALKSLFGWAVDNHKLPSNPAEGLTISRGRKVKLRERDFRPHEITAILNWSRNVNTNKAREKARKAALSFRWVPWLCAYSGARVGEVLQLRKADISKSQGSWVMLITPEAGTVKTNEYREVPLHQHLEEEGFMKFVEDAEDGYLFVVPEDGNVGVAISTAGGRLRKQVRELVPDPNVAPNHGWRHTFKSKGFEAGIQEKVLDALCGHAPSTTGRAYGSVSLKTKVDAMLQFPRYELDQQDGNG